MNQCIRYVHQWETDSSPLVFCTIPMIHIGEKAYYKAISILVNEMNHVLAEGIDCSVGGKELGKYETLAEKCGLGAQIHELNLPPDLPVINIDMEPKDFKQRFRKLPLINQIRFRAMKRTVEKLSKKYNLREMLKERIGYSEENRIKLINPTNHYFFTHKKADKFAQLIENDRNDIFQDKIKHYIEENKKMLYRIDTAIIASDEHMPTIYRMLEKHGYKWKLYKTLQVIE